MYEERKSNFNWLNLFIKVIIFVIFVLLLLWLISKISLKGRTSKNDKTTQNLNQMKEVALEYFSSHEKPTEVGESEKITLDFMLDNKLLLFVKDKNDNDCDAEKSYAELTKISDYYALRVELDCSGEKDYIYTTLTDLDCKECSSLNKEDKNNNGSNESNNNETSTNNTSSTTNKTTVNSSTTNTSKKKYYEYVKTTKSYGDWIEGTKTGSNIENKTVSVDYLRYCSISNQTYYTNTYVYEKDVNGTYHYNYTLKLLNIPSNASSIKINNSKYLSSYDDYLNSYNYINSKKQISMVNNDPSLEISNYSLSSYMNSALNANNFTYNISTPYYSNGSYYVTVDIYVKNTNNKAVYNGVYFVPVYFNVGYTSGDCVVDKRSEAANYFSASSSYEYTKIINYYRYVTTNKETKWSTATTLEGYTKTGNTKYE